MNKVINNNKLDQKIIKFIEDSLDKMTGLSIEDKKNILKNAVKKAGISPVQIPDDILIIHNIMMEGTDRLCVLMGSAYLENELTKLLDSFFIKDDKIINKLFEKDRPLSSFSSRIDISYSLGLIPAGVRKDLHLISKIRHIVENDSSGIGFENDEITSLCNKLIYDVAPGDDDCPRKKIIRVMMGLASMIHNSREKQKKCVPMNDKNIDVQRKKAEKLKEEILKDCT